MLEKDISERASFYDIIKSNFVSNNGKEVLIIDQIEGEEIIENSNLKNEL